MSYVESELVCFRVYLLIAFDVLNVTCLVVCVFVSWHLRLLHAVCPKSMFGCFAFLNLSFRLS